jgi:2-keto-4-pentenoate hydratase/2-oxohepta-3-ene-1,7-dioic acid hydratase in catechol pathway
MRRARFEKDGVIHEGTLSEDGDEITSSTGGKYEADEVGFLAPCGPTKVIGVGRNYAEHADELGNDVPDFPLFFLKPSTAVIGAGDDIVYPEMTDELHYEAELGVVIGRACRNVSEDEALDYVGGYTCVNDVTARDWQDRESQWFRAKGGDGFCPLGPCIHDEYVEDRTVETRLNGETVQESSTAMMQFGVAELVAEASRFVTLREGDVIATGTPEGVGPMEPGDTVEVDIEGIGTLENDVVEP